VPKPLIDVGGQTLIERHLSALSTAGFKDIVVNVSYLGPLIEQHINEKPLPGLSVRFSREPDEPLETGGGILRALPLLGDDPFLVINADIWTEHPLTVSGPKGKALAHLVLVPKPSSRHGGDFSLNGSTVERGVPNPYTYAGIGVYTPELFRGIKEKRFPLAPLLFDCVRENRLSGEVYEGVWFDVGTVDRLKKARDLIERSH
jgi:MurNAc alpha-1-phosphate uridylyltransferase